jgi:chromosome segregation ATPase
MEIHLPCEMVEISALREVQVSLVDKNSTLSKMVFTAERENRTMAKMKQEICEIKEEIEVLSTEFNESFSDLDKKAKKWRKKQKAVEEEGAKGRRFSFSNVKLTADEFRLNFNKDKLNRAEKELQELEATVYFHNLREDPIDQSLSQLEDYCDRLEQMKGRSSEFKFIFMKIADMESQLFLPHVGIRESIIRSSLEDLRLSLDQKFVSDVVKEYEEINSN